MLPSSSLYKLTIMQPSQKPYIPKYITAMLVISQEKSMKYIHYIWKIFTVLSVSCHWILMKPSLKNHHYTITNLKFLGRLFVSEGMSHENQQLAYKCQQLKSAIKIHSTWFFNNVVNIKLTEHRRIHKIFHVNDIENLLEIDNLEEYKNNASF